VPLLKISPWLSMNPKAHNFLTDFRYFCDLSVDTREAPFSWVGERLSGCSCLLITATSFHAVYQHILVQSSVHRFWRPLQQLLLLLLHLVRDKALHPLCFI
jgi:hypothetical protein